MTSKREKTQRNGFVLVVVLCMVIILAIILFGFNTESRMNLRDIDDYKKSKMINCSVYNMSTVITYTEMLIKLKDLFIKLTY